MSAENVKLTTRTHTYDKPVEKKDEYCCNLIDHRGLPIIHIESYRHNRHKRQEHRYRITYYIIS